jgi:hypothetical protein
MPLQQVSNQARGKGRFQLTHWWYVPEFVTDSDPATGFFRYREQLVGFLEGHRHRFSITRCAPARIQSIP